MDIETIKETLKKHDNYDVDDPAKNVSQKRENVESRAMYFKMCQDLNKMGLTAIGNSLSPKKNHATVLHGIRTMNDLIKIDKSYRARYKGLKARAKYYEEVRERNKALSFDECLVRIADLETKLKEIEKENIYFIDEISDLRDHNEIVKEHLMYHKRKLHAKGFDTNHMKVFNLLKYR
jgi:hypothetical protein